MRRIPPALWILAPLALALAYALVWPLFATEPTLADVVPADAVMTLRFKDQTALDRAWYRPKHDATRHAEAIAAQLNLAGLPGVDPNRPFHVVYLPREGRPTPSMAILPVADASKLRGRFEDASFFLEHGQTRHAQHLEIAGAWAGISPDREIIRHLGEGGISAEDLGEDHVVAIDVPALARFALFAPREKPWAAILGALGFDPTTSVPDEDGSKVEVEATRVVRVASAWRTARLWSFFDEHEIRLELVPTPGTRLAELLAQVYEDPSPRGDVPPRGRRPAVPRQAQAWIVARGAKERAALAWTLWSCGIAFPESLGTKKEPLGAWGRVEGADWLLLAAVPSIGTGYAWTLLVAAPTGTLPPLAPFHAAFLAEPGETDVGEGELTLTLADLIRNRTPPAGSIVFRRRDGIDVVTAGAVAAKAQDLLDTTPRKEPENPSATDLTPVTEVEAGWQVVATFGLDAARARTLLGDEIETGGLLAALGGGRISGTLLTDGKVLRLVASSAEGP